MTTFMHPNGSVVQTVVMTPDTMSNAQVAEYIIIALENGTDRGKQIARDEIHKMARICDEHAALMRGDK